MENLCVTTKTATKRKGYCVLESLIVTSCVTRFFLLYAGWTESPNWIGNFIACQIEKERVFLNWRTENLIAVRNYHFISTRAHVIKCLPDGCNALPKNWTVPWQMAPFLEFLCRRVQRNSLARKIKNVLTWRLNFHPSPALSDTQLIV